MYSITEQRADERGAIPCLVKTPSHIESEVERRIYQEVVRNWNRGEMKISTILLEGDAGSGKTQIAKALSADFNLTYTKVTCFADMDKSDVLGSILPVLSDKGNTDKGLFAGCTVRNIH